MSAGMRFVYLLVASLHVAAGRVPLNSSDIAAFRSSSDAMIAEAAYRHMRSFKSMQQAEEDTLKKIVNDDWRLDEGARVLFTEAATGRALEERRPIKMQADDTAQTSTKNDALSVCFACKKKGASGSADTDVLEYIRFSKLARINMVPKQRIANVYLYKRAKAGDPMKQGNDATKIAAGFLMLDSRFINNVPTACWVIELQETAGAKRCGTLWQKANLADPVSPQDSAESSKPLAQKLLEEYLSSCKLGEAAKEVWDSDKWSIGSTLSIGLNAATLGAALSATIDIGIPGPSLAKLLDPLLCVLDKLGGGVAGKATEVAEQKGTGIIPEVVGKLKHSLRIATYLSNECIPSFSFSFGFILVPFPPFIWPIPSISMGLSWSILGDAIKKCITDAAASVDKFAEAGKPQAKPEAKAEAKAGVGSVRDLVAKSMEMVGMEALTGTDEQNPAKQLGRFISDAWKFADTSTDRAHGPSINILPSGGFGWTGGFSTTFGKNWFSAFQSVRGRSWYQDEKDRNKCTTVKAEYDTEKAKLIELGLALWTFANAEESEKRAKDACAAELKKISDARGQPVDVRVQMTEKPWQLADLEPFKVMVSSGFSAGASYTYSSSGCSVGISVAQAKAEDDAEVAEAAVPTTQCKHWNDFVGHYRRKLAPAYKKVLQAEGCPVVSLVSAVAATKTLAIDLAQTLATTVQSYTVFIGQEVSQWITAAVDQIQPFAAHAAEISLGLVGIPFLAPPNPVLALHGWNSLVADFAKLSQGLTPTPGTAALAQCVHATPSPSTSARLLIEGSREAEAVPAAVRASAAAPKKMVAGSHMATRLRLSRRSHRTRSPGRSRGRLHHLGAGLRGKIRGLHRVVQE